VAAVKYRPVLHHYIFIFFLFYEIIDSKLLTIEKQEYRSCVSGVANFNTIDEQHQYNNGCYLPHAGYTF